MSFCNKSRTFPLPRRFPISQSCPPHIFWKVVTHSSDDIDDFDDDNDDDIDYFGDDDDANLGVWASSSFMRASIPTWLSSPPPPSARPASENTSYDKMTMRIMVKMIMAMIVMWLCWWLYKQMMIALKIITSMVISIKVSSCQIRWTSRWSFLSFQLRGRYSNAILFARKSWNAYLAFFSSQSSVNGHQDQKWENT